MSIPLKDYICSWIHKALKVVSLLSQNLNYLKQELIQEYNIPEYEFNWKNNTLYGNTCLDQLDI